MFLLKNLIILLTIVINKVVCWQTLFSKDIA